jgi:Papain family cysteine protease
MTKRRHKVRRILNCIESRERERDWTIDHAEAGGALAAAAPIPASKSLRESWWTIGNQGGTGSCVGWAAADGVLRWHFVKAGCLPKKELLSVRFIWMASKEVDEYTSYPSTFIEPEGTSPKAALDIARKFGIDPELVLPFTGGLFAGGAKEFYVAAAKFKIASYFNLGKKLSDWKRWIATKGPILTRLNVDDSWNYAADTGGRLDAYQAATAGGGHAVTLVGYTPDRFIVRNSWGTTWGDKGFGYASLAYAEAAFTEAYGISL